MWQKRKHLESYKLTPRDGQNNRKASPYNSSAVNTSLAKLIIAFYWSCFGVNSVVISEDIICSQTNKHSVSIRQWWWRHSAVLSLIYIMIFETLPFNIYSICSSCVWFTRRTSSQIQITITSKYLSLKRSDSLTNVKCCWNILTREAPTSVSVFVNLWYCLVLVQVLIQGSLKWSQCLSALNLHSAGCKKKSIRIS